MSAVVRDGPVCRYTREGGTYRQVTQPVRVLVAHRFCRGGLLLPSFSVGGDAITTADDDEADDDEDDEGDSWLLLTRPGPLAGVSGVCLGSGSLAGAMAKETIPPPFVYWVISAAAAASFLTRPFSVALRAEPGGPRK